MRLGCVYYWQFEINVGVLWLHHQFNVQVTKYGFKKIEIGTGVQQSLDKFKNFSF